MYDDSNIITGKIPLRQLVYRVLELPPSMRPLVYDFGQLNKKNENEYVAQIVKNHVCYLTCMLSLCTYLFIVFVVVHENSSPF